MTTEQKAHQYEMLKISIETLLKAYKGSLIDMESGLKDYELLGWDTMIALKKEHVQYYKAKIEVLTDLK